MARYEEDIYEDDLVRVQAEVRDGLLFCHCYPKVKSSVRLMKHLKWLWGNVERELYIAGFDYIHTYTPNMKFCEVLDDTFIHLGTITLDNKELEVLRWELIQSPSLSQL